MKRVRILVSIASSDGWNFEPGQIVKVGSRFQTGEEVPREFAEKWVAGGVVAEVVIGDDEVATLPNAPETAVTRGRRSTGKPRE